MQVADIMTTNVITVSEDALVSRVAEIIQQHHFTGVPVVNSQNTVIGLIAERDFITEGSGLYLPTYIKLLSETDYIRGGKKDLPYAVKQVVGAKARDIMNKHVFFATPSMDLEHLAIIFAEKRQNPVPVVDGENKLLGVVSRSDLIRLFSPSQIGVVRAPETHQHRAIDDEVKYVAKDFKSRFAYVAKARANVWLTTAIVLFVIGFVAGIVYVANPTVFFQ